MDKQGETDRRIQELQTGHDKEQRFTLSAEQSKELESFKKSREEIGLKLKQLRKQLRHEVELLGRTVKGANLLTMPFLVTALGVVLSVYNWKRSGAR